MGSRRLINVSMIDTTAPTINAGREVCRVECVSDTYMCSLHHLQCIQGDRHK